MSRPFVIAMITTDVRDDRRRYTEPEPAFGAAPTALLQGLAGMPGIEVHVVACVQKPVASPPKLADNMFYHSIVVGKWGWMRGAYAGCVMAVRRKLREIRPDMVHGQGTERYPAMAAVFSGYPNVITVHGKMVEIAKLSQARFGNFYWFASRLEEFTLPRTDAIVCISEYVENLIKKYGVPIRIVPNAIQKMFFDFPREEVPAPAVPLLINVGVVGERKRQPELLEVLESLRAEGLKFDTIFVGVSADHEPYPGRFKAMLESANAKHGGFKHIQSMDEPSFCRLYDRSSAMIHFSNEESFGLVFAEAIARGLYLFASDVGAIHDIAKGVERVQIFNLNDWEGLKKAVRQWLVSGGPAQPRPASPPREFTERYHPGEVAAKHVAIYREVAARKGKPADGESSHG